MSINNYEIKKIEKCLIKLGYKISSFNTTFYYKNNKKFFADIYAFCLVKNNNDIFELKKHRGPTFVFSRGLYPKDYEVIYQTWDIKDMLNFLKGYDYDL